MIPSDSERNLCEYINKYFPPEADSVKIFLFKMMKLMDNIQLIFDETTNCYKLILERKTLSVGMAFESKALHNRETMERLTLELKSKVNEMARKEIIGTSFKPYIDMNKECYNHLFGKDAIVESLKFPREIPVPEPFVLKDINELEENESLRIGNADKFFKKVKQELSERGDFEIDIVTFVDVLIKLGIAKPKD